MQIRNYQYIVPTKVVNDHIEIDGVNREDYATSQFITRVNEMVLDRPTAVLYAGGVGIAQSETRDVTSVNSRYVGTVDYQRSTMLIKEISAYSLHKWIGSMVNNEYVTYANVNHNTCASSMFSLYEAERLLESGEIEEVIVIAEERTSFNTIRIFKEHAIPLIVSDGFAIVRLWNGDGVEIKDTKWKYSWNRNPFGTTVGGYAMVDSDVSIIKPHGTGTNNNNKAEEELVKDRKVIYYKKDIGHSQGASALLELCMLIDDDSVNGDVLCVASGLGGFYGSCILSKTN